MATTRNLISIPSYLRFHLAHSPFLESAKDDSGAIGRDQLLVTEEGDWGRVFSHSYVGRHASIRPKNSAYEADRVRRHPRELGEKVLKQPYLGWVLVVASIDASPVEVLAACRRCDGRTPMGDEDLNEPSRSGSWRCREFTEELRR